MSFAEADTEDDPFRLGPKPDPVRMTSAANQAEQAKQDIRDLMDMPQFHRFLLTVVEMSGIQTPDHQMDSAVLAQKSGRRNLGLEVLTAIRAVEPGVDVFLAVEKSKTQEIRR